MSAAIADERGGLPSGSNMDKVLNCPGSPAAERYEGEPPVEEEDWAAQGTRIHKALETNDLSLLDEEETELARRLERMIEEGFGEWLAAFELQWEQTKVGKEERFWMHDRRTLAALASAQLDRVYVNGPFGLVIDTKTGFLDAAPAYLNAQLKTQAVVLWHEYPALSHIRVAIAQHRFKSKYDYCDYDLEALRLAEQDLLFGFWRARQPDAPRFPGTWCRYCRARGVCREAAAYSLLPVVTLDVADQTVSKKEIEERVSRLSHRDLAAVQSRKSVAENIFKAVSDRLKSLPAAQLAAVGFTLSEGDMVREVSNAQALFALLYGEKLCTEEEFADWIKVGLTDMEAVLVPRLAQRQGGTQKAARAALAGMIGPFIKLKPKAPSLQRLKG
jgi:hypothetical protein